MNAKLVLISALVAAIGLSACGGGGGSATPPTPVPAVLSTTDTVVGTGAEAVTGKTVSVHYTGWLYATGAAGFKGTKFDSSAGRSPLTFKIGVSQVIPGFEQGVTGMRVGGKRTVLIPSSLGYGAGGSGPIPPNAGLVFDLELVEVK